MKINPHRTPDFGQLARVLQGKKSDRPVLFDFIIGQKKEQLLTGSSAAATDEAERVKSNFAAFENAGYDHASIVVRGLEFVRNGHGNANAVTKSLNEGTVISDRQSFDSYHWPEISDCDFSIISKTGGFLHKGVKMIPFSLDGILENTVGILGYENLCYLLYDDMQLVSDVFWNVGSRIEQYYLKCLEFDEVGAVLCNDDWGFNSQTMLPPALLRKHVFPWYKRIVQAAHDRGKYAILHSCGYYDDIIDDIIQDMRFDGKHSYEDKIRPVEKAYEKLCGKIAVLGGIDVDFLARSSPEQIYERCINLLRQTQMRGYALGSGNSIPDYVPDENYLAMLEAANETRK